jgi:hypothetical protein
VQAQSNGNDNLYHRVRNENATIGPPSIPKSGFRTLHACTTFGSTCGKALLACWRCGVPIMIGRIQSTAIPRPTLAPFGTKPAWLHAAVIFAQGCQGTGGTGTVWADCASEPVKSRLIRLSVILVGRMTPPASRLQRCQSTHLFLAFMRRTLDRLVRHFALARLSVSPATNFGPLRGRLAPDVLERLGRHRGIAHRVRNAGMTQEVL